MSSKSKIEWCDASWQPIAGCTKCSPGCLNCYAERMAFRQYHMADARCTKNRSQRNLVTAIAYGKAINKTTRKWTGDIGTNRCVLNDPRHWRKPRRIFVCSMSDLFHPQVPFEFIEKVMAVIEECPQHTFQILTKRPHIMFEYFSGIGKLYELSCCPNVHLGVSISNQKEADEKIPILLQIPAAVRWLSIEPMLGGIKLNHIKTPERILNALKGKSKYYVDGNTPYYGHSISWVVVGGESGPGARPMHPDWVRGIRDQCVPNGIPFFFKQHGEWVSGADKYALKIETYNFYPKRVTRIGNTTFFRVTKKLAGRMLDGREWSEYPK